MPAFPWLPTWLPLQVSLVGSSGSPSPAKVQSPWCGRWIRIWMPGFHHSVGSSPWTWHFGSAYLTYLDHKEITYWTIKKAEPQRTGAFELWCWRRLLRVTWTARRSNQSILKEINPEYSLEGLILRWSSNIVATWYEELTHWKRPWCWERLRAGGEGDDRE